ncbi:probable U3 small nucleolar RNA-associated protein 7 [Drosophila grimshawi]|uniref:GH24866 n=1 Tax=Drosophila grimshawi TaxID=7222 RepID=B4JNR2_DROGR|nr:probable U3 small nucleolar RNA-associated protein 7 [Drosophila grimshawi]EDV92355.1 GH24866 [Drosophila grimshawi]
MTKTAPKGRKKPPARYFDVAAGKSEDDIANPIKLKRRNQQNFKGDFLKMQSHYKKQKFDKKKPTGSQDDKPKVPKISKELMDKYSRGDAVDSRGIKTRHFKEQQQRKEIYLEYATEQAARTELLLQETAGQLEADAEETTAGYRQEEIAANVDLQSAAKHFALKLDFGPYTMRYTKNGRHLLLGGRRGHVAAFDWVTKKLHCEFNVMETVADVQWLHVPTMYAVAQKEWVYFYDKKGTELHCVKRLTRVNRLDFLPYHFLLAAANSAGYASWLDVSIGELVGNFSTGLGDIRHMRHNPSNGVLCIGGGKGVVSMWSPKVREPLATILCHSTAMTALTVDPKGMHLVTAGLDRMVKVWDIRNLNDTPLATFRLRLPANELDVSQRGMLALSQGTYLETYTDVLEGGGTGLRDKLPYLRQRCDASVHGLRFCPYEDVLGVSTANGFHSLLVPGAGEPNYDALEDNPYETSKQRREHEVHALLEKIPPELITLDPHEITGVDAPTLQEKIDAKRQLFHLKPPRININPRHKMKGRGGTAKAARNKQIVKDMQRKDFIAEVRKAKKGVIADHKLKNDGDAGQQPKVKKERPVRSVLDRFKPKQQNQQKSRK